MGLWDGLNHGRGKAAFFKCDDAFAHGFRGRVLNTTCFFDGSCFLGCQRHLFLFVIKEHEQGGVEPVLPVAEIGGVGRAVEAGHAVHDVVGECCGLGAKCGEVAFWHDAGNASEDPIGEGIGAVDYFKRLLRDVVQRVQSQRRQGRPSEQVSNCSVVYIKMSIV